MTNRLEHRTFAEMLEPRDQSAREISAEFPRDMLPLLHCSRDAGPLALAQEFHSSSSGITDATLLCGTCGAEYRIEHGIARLMDGALSPENEHEISLRDAEYGGLPPGVFVPPDRGWRSQLNDLLEVPPHLDALEPLEDALVLEIGCGDGRFTMLMAQRGARVLAVDFSLGALQKLACWLPSGLAPTTHRIVSQPPDNGCRGRVGLVQADGGRFHVAHRMFDRALSATPLDGRDERMSMYRAIADALKDTGRFVGGVEHDDLSRRVLGLPTARRYSPGGIFLEHFDMATMRREAAPFFSKLHISPIRPRVPFIHRLPLGLAVRLARLIAATPGMRNLGEILLMRAEQPVRPPVEGARRAGSKLIKSLYRWFTRKNGQPPVWDSELV
jgi:SAM-dependent methyltransferase